MRNWNPAIGYHLPRLAIFLYYLWGIETTNFNSTNINNICLFILPMRNWNYNTVHALFPSIGFLFILPMRNWNQFLLFRYAVKQTNFLYYLWGIETWHGVIYYLTTVYHFLYYLWGIETCFQILFWNLFLIFLYYLWGIETIFHLD